MVSYLCRLSLQEKGVYNWMGTDEDDDDGAVVGGGDVGGDLRQVRQCQQIAILPPSFLPR